MTIKILIKIKNIICEFMRQQGFFSFGESLSSRLYEILRGIEKGIIYTLNEPGAKKIP
jgi:hypothetical protein